MQASRALRFARLQQRVATTASSQKIRNFSTKESEPLLFTPGPLTTSMAVKKAMLFDYGSRDPKFTKVTSDIREGLLKIAGVNDDWTTVLMQGAGSHGVECVISSIVPRKGKLLVTVNGAYGDRIAKMCSRLDIEVVALSSDWNTHPTLEEIEKAIKANPDLSCVAMVHSETTSGIMNPVEKVGKMLRYLRPDIPFVVDAMSSFGAVPLDLEACNAAYMVSSANKCIQGVPGFSFVLARKAWLEASEGNARSLALDLHDQWRGLEASGQFRFTPPTHVMLAFRQAMAELEEEGGVPARHQRYAANQRRIAEGFQALGFGLYLDQSVQGPIITTVMYPDHEKFDFTVFYDRMCNRGFAMYAGKFAAVSTFRVGNIGHIFMDDVERFLTAAEEELKGMGVVLK